jgi:large subunit ribosomal protein L17
MPRPAKGPRLGGGPAHEKLMLANMAAHLFAAEAITTTEAKAKRLRPFAEKLITKAKKGGIHNHRLVASELRDKETAAKLFSEIAQRYAERDGGYLRILKLGPRQGDHAPMARIELV